MFSSRKFLSFGLRMTLNLLQENLKSMQSFYRPLLSIQKNSLAYSRNAGHLNYKPPLQFDDTDEGKKLLAELEGKLQLIFTCKKCKTRNNKIITKHAYEKGVVVVRCDGCKNNHLIADNLGWFEGTGPKNIESIMRNKGETVRRIRDNSEGYFEVLAQEEVLRIQQNIDVKDKSEIALEKNVRVLYEKVGEPEKKL